MTEMPLRLLAMSVLKHLELGGFTDKDQSSLPLYDFIGYDWTNVLFTNGKGEGDEAGSGFSSSDEKRKYWLDTEPECGANKPSRICVNELEEGCLCCSVNCLRIALLK